MFKFLFKRNAEKVEALKETQRDTITRAMGEINEVLDLMPEKPKLSVNLSTGRIEFDLPEQMPDEALQLPAPEKDEAAKVADTKKPEAPEAPKADENKGEQAAA